MKSEQIQHTENNLSWKELLKAEREKDYFKNILLFIEQERCQDKIIYPANCDIFNAFKFTEFSKIKAVIIGQDPYHGSNQAHGLCFSVQPGVAIPPSLQNIFKELKSDLDIDIPTSGDLTAWTEQGVLLLNSCLSVEAGKPGSHAEIGWQTFTDFVIKTISDQSENIVFLLWGAYAQKKSELIDSTKHHILSTTHPSPFSAHKGFLGSKHFSKTNQILSLHGIPQISWNLN